MDVKNVISSSLGGMIGVTVILICVPCPFYTIIMFYMYSRRKEIIVLSYSLMIRKHCGKTQTYTHKEKNKKSIMGPNGPLGVNGNNTNTQQSTLLN